MFEIADVPNKKSPDKQLARRLFYDWLYALLRYALSNTAKFDFKNQR